MIKEIIHKESGLIIKVVEIKTHKENGISIYTVQGLIKASEEFFDIKTTLVITDIVMKDFEFTYLYFDQA